MGGPLRPPQPQPKPNPQQSIPITPKDLSQEFDSESSKPHVSKQSEQIGQMQPAKPDRTQTLPQSTQLVAQDDKQKQIVETTKDTQQSTIHTEKSTTVTNTTASNSTV